MTPSPHSAITVREAEHTILDAVPRLAPLSVPLAAAPGRILRGDVTADRDLPPFDRVMMDGVAFAFHAWCGGVRCFHIEGTAAAGGTAATLQEPAAGCVQVMTGAVLPLGSDTVVPCEELEVAGDCATVGDEKRPERGQFVHRQGSDGRKGDRLLAAGRRLRAPCIGLAASAGAAELLVSPFPRVAVVSNGDELVDLDRPVLPHQIRPSNNYGMAAALALRGFDTITNHHLPDDPEVIRQRLEQILAGHDVVVLSGGVSAGKLDFVPEALRELGMDKRFHKVSQRPGKPMWFGTAPTGAPVFALPGNPVSALVCFHRYVLPALDHMMGAAPSPKEKIRLGQDIHFEPPLTGFRPVRREMDADGTPCAVPVRYHGSGDLSVLAASDGFVEMDRAQSRFAAGSWLPFTAWMGGP